MLDVLELKLRMVGFFMIIIIFILFSIKHFKLIDRVPPSRSEAVSFSSSLESFTSGSVASQ